MHKLAWLLTAGLVVSTAGSGQAQFFHRQRPSPSPYCPIERPAASTLEPPAAMPKVEPPAVTPKMVEPPAVTPKMIEPSPPVVQPEMSQSQFETDMGSSELSTFDSSVGYIDNAIPANVLRLRYDAAYRANRPTRAEFFYARGAPLGPGLPLPELQDDYQEITAYGEALVNPYLSLFVETPVRFLNPEINTNHAGFGDMNFGCKYALSYCPDQVLSFQWRTWVPTGDTDKGLGNDHVSLEPGLLLYQKLSERLRLESELRYWIPIGGTSFAGDVIRYGVGFSYGERPADALWLTPVVEVVGWTVLDGEEAVAPPLPPLVADAAGDTIVNLKLGLRIGLGNVADFYTGYGRALTGEVWYKDIIRTELRLAF